MRVAFMGTPDFAVPSLEALMRAGHEIVGVFTQPDRPQGRGNRVGVCPVKRRALDAGLAVYQFERIRRKEGLAALRALAPDVCVTAAFGQILSQKLLDVPRFGTVNVHASLLPRYRGSAPINWCLYEGERETGVTTMMTDAGIDTGDILLQRALVIGDTESAGELSARLSELGARLLIETLALLERGECPRARQDESRATHQPMLTRQDGKLDFSRTAKQLSDHVRAFDPWPGAYIETPRGALKVIRARALDTDASHEPGQLLAADAKRGLVLGCAKGALEVLELTAPGGKRMKASDYLRGNALIQRDILL